jgi:hypothetical protein
MPDEPFIPIAVSSPLLARAADALTRCSNVCASALAAYRAAHNMTEAELAAWLGLANVTALHGLALCTRPDAGGATYAADVRRIAAALGCAHERLLSLLTDIASPPVADGREPRAP